MVVKLNGVLSTERKINGGGPQGSNLGILEYLSLSNDNADTIPENQRFKFVDDATGLEVLNLLSIGLSSYNTSNHISSYIPVGHLYLPPENTK